MTRSAPPFRGLLAIYLLLFGAVWLGERLSMPGAAPLATCILPLLLAPVATLCTWFPLAWLAAQEHSDNRE